MKLPFDRPLLMGILNVTPDSFSDGGLYTDPGKALHHLETLLQDDADIIDIGAQSTFGQSALVDGEEEWRRLEPVLSKIDYTRVFVSLDTFRTEVARKALELGVQMINDVTALRQEPELLQILLQYQPYYCLMFSAHETPYAQKKSLRHTDVVSDIKAFLFERTGLLLRAGFPREKIIVDPGMGMFLSADPRYSWEVLERLDEISELGFPVLVGPSMKSFLGGAMNERRKKTLEASRIALKHGASILRVHHLSEHRRLVDDWLRSD